MGRSAVSVSPVTTIPANSLPQTIDDGRMVVTYSKSAVVDDRSAAKRTATYTGTNSMQVPSKIV